MRLKMKVHSLSGPILPFIRGLEHVNRRDSQSSSTHYLASAKIKGSSVERAGIILAAALGRKTRDRGKLRDERSATPAYPIEPINRA